jgi:cellulose synthase (UDP-forming)
LRGVLFVHRRPNDARISLRGYYAIYSVTIVAFLLMVAYVSTRVIMTITEKDFSLSDAVMATLLLGAELFLCMHAVGYFFNVVKAGRRQATLQPLLFSRHTRARVAVLVAAFNESEDVLEDTFASIRAMDYPVNVYLLDDSTQPDCLIGAQRVADKYGAQLVHRTNRAGYKAGAINDILPRLTEPYIALLDADQKPRESWLKEIVPYMEEQPTLGLVQSPQHYINDAGLPVCTAAKYQQAVFFEYICEGKSYSNAMFCCGSNCVIRRDALLSIATEVNGRTHYFDETSVTEDFATTFRLHLKGWRTDYVNEKYAVGMGPETLTAYFTQQMRWAMGTQGQCRPLLKKFLRNPRALTPAQWWEYWMVGTYFFVGIPNFIFMLAPIAFMLLDIRPVRSNATMYLVFFVPYVIFSMNLFFLGMKLRRYDVKGVWLASALSFSTFWIYMKAAMVAVLGLKRAFAVTPKSVGGAIPLRRLWMELLMFTGNCATSAWCVYHLVLTHGGIAYIANGVWSTYHAVLLSTLFVYFNRPVTVTPPLPLFADYPLKTVRAPL